MFQDLPFMKHGDASSCWPRVSFLGRGAVSFGGAGEGALSEGYMLSYYAYELELHVA
jgi:hypothetical protein